MVTDAFDRLSKLIRPAPVARGLAALAMLAWSSVAITSQPFADVHVHFNWDQREVIDAEQVALILRCCVGHFRRVIEYAHETLCQHAYQAGRQKERLDAHVA